MAEFDNGKIGKTVCYKKENYMTKGWCRTVNWRQDGENVGETSDWGICSESCKYLKDIAKGSSGTVYKVCKLSLSSTLNLFAGLFIIFEL